MSKRNNVTLFNEAKNDTIATIETLLEIGMSNITIKKVKKWNRYDREYVHSLEVSAKVSFVAGIQQKEAPTTVVV